MDLYPYILLEYDCAYICIRSKYIYIHCCHKQRVFYIKKYNMQLNLLTSIRLLGTWEKGYDVGLVVSV